MSSAPHILTLTGNLLAERTLQFESWAIGKTQRARSESFQVGGKGINVSKMLNRLGAPNTALCFTGGASGAECEAWLREKKFAFHSFATAASTRTGTVVRAPGCLETTFLGSDQPPPASALQACADFLATQPTGTVLAVCGSLPGWDSAEYDVLRDALRRWPERGPLVVDTYGPPLAWFADSGASFIRLNRTEIQALFPELDRNTAGGEYLRSARQRFSALRWALSDGSAPVWFVAEHEDPLQYPSPKVYEISATGSGDVMLACILYGRFHRGMRWREAVAWALPYAAANAAHPGVAEFPDPTV
jgi:fructose-1-phosphate kinase PfkB-like protein